MQIFQKEIDAGLSELLTASFGSIKYDIPLMGGPKVTLEKIIASKAIASHTDSDLFPINSLMVSVGWNKNDDVFLRDIVYGARHTPEDKPLNLQHKELDIVGHIISNYVIDNDGNVIPDDTKLEDLPETFHIIASSVMYTVWQDTTRAETINTIKEEIVTDLAEKDKSKAKWYVSMECLFSGFDYAVIAPDGTQAIIARDEKSAFLTAHLRAYGGTGQYNDYKIGRAMKNLTFSALGLVNNPANPASVIFDGVLSFREETNSHVQELMETAMANENTNDNAQALITEYKTKLEAMETEKATVVEKLEKAESMNKEHETKIAAFEQDVKTLNEKVTSLEAAKADVDVKLTEATKRAEAAEQAVADYKLKEITSARILKLTEKGLAKDEAEKKVSKFAALNDEQFEAVAELIQAPVAKVEPVKTEADAGAAAASVVEKAKASEVPALVATATVVGDGEIEKAKAEVLDLMRSEVVGQKSKNNKKK